MKNPATAKSIGKVNQKAVRAGGKNSFFGNITNTLLRRKPIEVPLKTKTVERKPAIAKQKKRGVTMSFKTGIPGFDDLLEKGIPEGSSVLVAGGAGSGKTLFCLQIAANAAKNGRKALYVSLEEAPNRLEEHMHDFNIAVDDLENKKLLRIIRVDPFRIARSVEGLLAKATGELMIDLEDISEFSSRDFKPEVIIIDSITALAAAFGQQQENYRIYVEQLFRYFEQLGVNSYFISETEQQPTQYSRTGVEEFLADGVIVIYHIKHGNIRERAIEILKLRGAKHKQSIVAMRIEDGKGVMVYPEQELFTDT
ncbi:MAG: ATPase domain-containing protein [Candidatus Micrarchaeota archaeon]